MQQKIVTLINTMREIVNDDSLSWRDKRAMIKAALQDKEDMNSLEEFLSWFEEDL